MPYISDIVVSSVFYLFQDEESALNSEKAGGTGFFVHMKSDDGNDCIYAVTNRHVIEQASAFVIRVNTNDGGFDTIPLTLCDWVNHPNGADIAIASVEINHKHHRYSPIPAQFFVSKESVETQDVDIGDEVYMLGRFIHHGGKTFNMPSARSGIISVLPNSKELIPMNPRYNMPDQEAFLVEMRSISGYSGSPVFLHNDVSDFMIKLQSILGRILDKNDKLNELLRNEPHVALAGIDAGNFPMYEDVLDAGDDYKKTPFKAVNHSGFSIVIPAWKIVEALKNCDEFIMQRKELDKKSKYKESAVRLDFGEKEESSFTETEFENALKKASQKTFSPDSEKKETLE